MRVKITYAAKRGYDAASFHIYPETFLHEMEGAFPTVCQRLIHEGFEIKTNMTARLFIPPGAILEIEEVVSAPCD